MSGLFAVSILALAHYVSVEDLTGKIHIGGIMDVVFVHGPALDHEPMQIPPFFAIARVISFDGPREHDVLFEFVNQDGQPFGQHRLRAQFAARGSSGRAGATFNLFLPTLIMPGLGDFQFRMSIDGNVECATPLSVVRAS